MAKATKKGRRTTTATGKLKTNPLTLSLTDEQLDLITRAAEAADDVRANWCRRMLLRLARTKLGIPQPVDANDEK